MKKKDKAILKKRKALIKSVRTKRRQYIKLICKICKEEFNIHVNNKDIYTDKVIKNWKCLSCSYKKLKGVNNEYN